MGRKFVKYGIIGAVAVFAAPILLLVAIGVYDKIYWAVFEPQLERDFSRQLQHEGPIPLSENFVGQELSELKEKAEQAGFTCDVKTSDLVCKFETDTIMDVITWNISAKTNAAGKIASFKAYIHSVM